MGIDGLVEDCDFALLSHTQKDIQENKTRRLLSSRSAGAVECVEINKLAHSY